MASTSSSSSMVSSSPNLSINIANYISIKLSSTNYVLWKTQFLPILASFDLIGLIDGSDPQPSKFLTVNGVLTSDLDPVYVDWVKKDRLLMIWLNATISESVLPYVVGSKTSSELWNTLERRFSSSSHAHSMQLRKKLQTFKKDSLSIHEYLQAIKEMTDLLAASGSPVNDKELLVYILSGLPEDYDSFSTSVRVRSDPVTHEELHGLLLSEELTILERSKQLLNASSSSPHALAASKVSGQQQSSRFVPSTSNQGRGKGRTFQPSFRGFSPSYPQNFSQQPYNPTPPSTYNISTPQNPPYQLYSSQNTSQYPQYSSQYPTPFAPPKIICQICGKPNHTAIDCHNRMNNAFQGPIPTQRLPAMVAQLNDNRDNIWLADSGASSQAEEGESWEIDLSQLFQLDKLNPEMVASNLLNHNLFEGRGLFCRECLRVLQDSPRFSEKLALVVFVINGEVPEIGKLLLHRVVSSFNYYRGTSQGHRIFALLEFLAHLVNVQVVGHQTLVDILTDLLECPGPTTLEAVVRAVVISGYLLTAECTPNLERIFIRLHGLQIHGDLPENVNVMIKNLFLMRRDGFERNSSLIKKIGDSEHPEKVCHTLSFIDELQPMYFLDLFKPVPKFRASKLTNDATKSTTKVSGGVEDACGEDRATEDQLITPWTTSVASEYSLLRDPHHNKGLAFSVKERDVHCLRGLLPPTVASQDLQVKKLMHDIRQYKVPLQRYMAMMDLQNMNERLFYKLFIANVEELLPVVYTPTVGEACQKYGNIFRRPQGLYISLNEKDEILKVFKNWPVKSVRVIVVTDGERILGLGDLGCQGMGIPVGKLALYTALGGLHPSICLPVTIDVGTNNEKLLKDDFYIGLRQKRATGQEYAEVLDEFMSAVKKKYGEDVLIQFEDFADHNAFALLAKYRKTHLVFNDDIQGTASVVLAGIVAALKSVGGTLAEHTFLFLGAGVAGAGIAELIALEMSKQTKAPLEETRKKIWLVDSMGLIVDSRKESLQQFKKPWAHEHEPIKDFLDAVKAIKPSVLIGSSGVGQFTQDVVETMSSFYEKPIILALSKPSSLSECTAEQAPSSLSECTAEQAYTWSKGRAIYASVSPFDPVMYDDKVYVSGQANNAYIFPGFGLGLIISGAILVHDDMLLAASEALAEQVTQENLDRGLIFPPLSNIRKISAHIAAKVAAKVYELGLATKFPRPDNLVKYAESQMYRPDY